jgi:hypothetical protein
MGVKWKRKRNDKLFKNIEEAIKETETAQIEIGFFPESRYPDDHQPVAAVAQKQEFGYAPERIPPRPFIRPVNRDEAAKWGKIFAKSLEKNGLSKNSVALAFELVGLAATGDYREKIASITSPPLSPVTVALKGGRTKPLIDTGLMVKSITHKYGSKK